MCNEVRRRIALGQLREDFSQTRIPLRFPEGLPNLAPLDSIRITDPNAMVRIGTEGAELVVRRWSWPGPNRKPVYNFRADGREFSSGRCLVIADGFYEFTTPADPKTKRKHKWLFTKKDEPWFCIAGLWRSTQEVGEAFTLLTLPPGPDVAPFHDRQIAVLDRSQWADWIDPAVPAKDVLRTLPGGTFEIAQVA
jgi:putative SOS response-associated peptidase YedK